MKSMDGQRTNWIITRVALSREMNLKSAVGTMGPSDMILSENEIKTHPDRIQFKMYDDDKNLYYVGLMVVGPEGDEFGPLDDFGAADSGCTIIKIKNKITGKWEEV